MKKERSEKLPGASMPCWEGGDRKNALVFMECDCVAGFSVGGVASVAGFFRNE